MKQPETMIDDHTNHSVKRVRLTDYLDVLLVWKRFIIVNVVIITAIAIVVSLILPKWYRATASILPPKDQGLLNFFGSSPSMLRGLSSLTRLGGINQPSGVYNYFAILKSRSVMEAVARKFDLVSVYEINDSSMEKVLKQLKDNVAFESQDDDYITIDVYDKDPQRAAAMANAFVEILNQRSIELGTQEARNNRFFIEKRINDTRDSLQQAEESLKRFQERSGMMMTPEQTSSISAIAELYALKAKKEIELAILERKVTPDNDALRQAQLELRELDKKLATFPQTGLETFRLYRDVMTQQKILEVLVPLYEQAKINEQKDVPVLLVLDKAVPPERKIKPQRSLIVFLAFALSGMFFTMLVFVLHRYTTRTSPDTSGSRVDRLMQRIAQRLSVWYRISRAT